MKEIKIANSKLLLRVYSSLDSILKTKDKLRYHELVGIDRGCMSIYHTPLYSKIPGGKVIIPSAPEYMSLVVGNIKNGDQTYDCDEVMYIHYYLADLVEYGRLDTAEELIGALGDYDTPERFYSILSPGKKLDFRKYCIAGSYNKASGSFKNSETYRVRGGYDVYTLLHDLADDHSLLYLDPALLGKVYTKMSPSYRDPSGAVSLPDRWIRVEGLVGNMQRANLSLQVKTKTQVTVPANDLGVASGVRELQETKNLCVVCDGKIWMPEIAVRPNSKELLKKLKLSKYYQGDVVFSDEVYLNLCNGPVLRRDKMKSVDFSRISRATERYEVAKIKQGFLSAWAWKMKNPALPLPESRPKDVISDAEKYLQSLGIYGDTYIPQVLKRDPTGSMYLTSLLESKVSGIPSMSPWKSYHRYIESSGTWKTSCTGFIKALDEVKALCATKTIPEVREILEKEKKSAQKVIWDQVFKLAMAKVYDSKLWTGKYLKVSWRWDDTTVEV